MRHHLKQLVAGAATLVLTVAVTACASGGSGSSGKGYSDDEVRIGVIASFSGAGASAGRQWRAGVEMAASDLNAKGGLDGHKIKLLAQDDKTEPSAGVAAARKIISQDPFAVLGSVQSTVTVVNAKTLQKEGIPQLPASEADTITDGKNDNVFQTSMTANNQQNRLNEYVERLKPKRAALLYGNTEVNIVGAKAIRQQLKKLGVKIVSDHQFDAEQTDYSGDVARIQRAKPDIIFLHMLEEAGGRALPAIARTGLNKQATIIGNNVLASGEVLDLAGKDADGVRALNDPPPETDPSMRAISARFREKYSGEQPSNNFQKGYIAMQAIAAGVNGAGKLDREEVKDYLHDRTICREDFPGLLASTYWDKAGRAYRKSYIVEVKNGKPTTVSTVQAPKPAKLAKCGDQ